jgi:polysaccharide export outer membrane protein
VSHENSQQAGRTGGRVTGRRIVSVSLLAVVPFLGACEADSYLDPSVSGRWEHTPTVVPILERIASVERGDEDFVEATDVVPEDLIALPVEPALSPGDILDIRIRDYFRVGVEDQFQGLVDKRGYVQIPRLPPIGVQGLTLTQAREKIAQTIQQEGLLNDPVVTVIPVQVRQNTFSAFGSVSQPGTYFIPNADYRLLEALTTAGGWSETVPEIFVIRQIALSEEVSGQPMATPATQPTTPTQQPEELIDLIDELSRPPQGGAPAPAPSPGMVGNGSGGAARTAAAPRRQPAGEETPPLVDLPTPAGRGTPEGVAQPMPRGGFNWVFLNGQWVRVSQSGDDGAAGGPDSDGLDADQLVTQRVIRIPMAPLISGSRKYNIVIRPGDIIRVPVVGQGIVYLAGQVARPGTYGIPVTGRLTLMRAIDAAGGLSQIAIPERVDVTRMIGSNAQAMVRVNLRAINEGTEPDLFLKPDDRINVGTNFWAYPLAVIRGGFRASYGFGFLLDRNFGNDVFGAPPENNGF